MPTYCYECESCDARQQHTLSISSHPEEMPCGCGGRAAQLYNWQGDSFVKGRDRPFKLDERCAVIDWNKGNTPEKQEARYAKIVQETGTLARVNDKAAIKGGIRHIARVPREVVRSRNNEFGKDYLDPSQQSTSDIKDKLKADGLLFQRR